jgi:O-antigen/teichoic acid export membrane protein
MSARRGPLLLLAAAAFASVGNFVFHAVGSRLLGPVDYSSLAALMALLVVVAVPVGAVQTAVTQASAAAPDASAVETVERSTRAGVILIVIGLGLALPLDRMLALHDAWSVALTAAWAAVACIGAVAKGALLGRLRYGPVALSLVVAASARIAFGVVLVPAFHVEGAMLATIGGEALAAVVAIAAMRGDLLAFQARALRPRASDASIALVAQLGLWVLAGITTIVGRRVLPDVAAGEFAAASTVTNAAAFLPLAVATAFFPRFARDGSRRTLTQALALASGLGGAVAVGLVVAPGWAVHLLAGRGFTADPAVVGMLAVQSAVVGCAGVAMFFLLAGRRTSALLVWAGAASACVGAFAVRDARALAAVALVTALVAAVLTIGAAYRRQPARDGIDLSYALPDPEFLLTVVVPSFNGGAQLRPTVDALCRSLDATGWRYEIIVAVDGSTDGSVATLTQLPGHVIVDPSPINEGKGAALRRGFRRARGAYIGFIDGDGDIDVDIVRRLARACQQPGVWAAIASKHTEGADVNMSLARTTFSRLYRSLVRALFSLDVSDTQCGAKVFSRRGLERALPWTRENGFAFDVELLGLGHRLGLGDVVELPVRLHRVEGRSTVSARHALRTLEETLRVWSRVVDAPSEVEVG